MRIYIPTKGRLERQLTVTSLPASLLKKYETTLVCPVSEARALMKVYGHSVSILPTRAQDKGIYATRQFIVDHALASGHDYAFMIDDDIGKWFTNGVVVNDLGEEKLKAVRALSSEVADGFDDFYRVMRTSRYRHGAMGHRLFSNARPLLNRVCFMRSVVAVDPAVLDTEGIKYRLPVMEDLDVQLRLLRAGYPNLEYNMLVWDDNLSQGAPGGCSTFLNRDIQFECSQKLEEYHAPFVKAIVKPDGWPTVRVAWKRAYKSSL